MEYLKDEITTLTNKYETIIYKVGSKVHVRDAEPCKDMWIVSIYCKEGDCKICVVDEDGLYETFDNDNEIYEINLKVVE